MLCPTSPVPTRHQTQLLRHYWLYALCCALQPQEDFVTAILYFLLNPFTFFTNPPMPLLSAIHQSIRPINFTSEFPHITCQLALETNCPAASDLLWNWNKSLCHQELRSNVCSGCTSQDVLLLRAALRCTGPRKKIFDSAELLSVQIIWF